METATPYRVVMPPTATPPETRLHKSLMKILERLDGRLDRIERNLAAGPADDDRWTRLPAKRCPFSGWSRSTILNYIRDGLVRTKKVRGARFYAAADVALIMGNKPTFKAS